MINAFPEKSVDARVVTQQGNVTDILEQHRLPVIQATGISQFDNTRYGYYRRYRWALLIREILFLLPTFRSILKAKKRWPDTAIIHVNEITNLFPIIIAKLIFQKPVIVHCRSVQQRRFVKYRYRIIEHLLNKFADRFIAIDHTVKDSLPDSLDITVIHNGLNTPGQDNSENHSQPGKEEPLKKNTQDTIHIAMVGNLLKFKGVYDFMLAAEICIQKNYQILFYFVGAVPPKREPVKNKLLRKIGLHHHIGTEIYDYIRKHSLTPYFRFIGFTQDIHSIYENIDVLCFPSHLDAVGRPVIEAALYKIPSIVAITDPKDDTIIDRETGICIEPKNHEALADAMDYFYNNRNEIQRMGNSAYRLACKNFNVRDNSRKVLKLYRDCLAASQ